MADYRKQTNYYCEYCNVWMANHTQVRASHERGLKHKSNVERRLSEMRRKSDREKMEQEETQRAMLRIDAVASRQYEADKAAEEEYKRSTYGTWEFQSGSGYYYNAVHKWYYDLASRMYYGGDPPDWTNSPPIPNESLYVDENNNIDGGGDLATTAATTTTTAKATVTSRTIVPGSKIVHAHPLAGVGGYQMPEVGRIGGAKGIGVIAGGHGVESTNASGSTSGAKRKRDGSGGGGGGGGGAKNNSKSGGQDNNPLSKEEAEFLAKREAARQRVQARTMKGFGLG